MTRRNKKREKSNSEVERVTMERKEDIVTWEKIMRLKRHEPLFIQTIFSYSHSLTSRLRLASRSAIETGLKIVPFSYLNPEKLFIQGLKNTQDSLWHALTAGLCTSMFCEQLPEQQLHQESGMPNLCGQVTIHLNNTR